MIPKNRAIVHSIKRIVLMIDVVGVADLNQTIGVVEPAELGFDMKGESIRVCRDTSRRLIFSRAPQLIIRTCHSFF